VAAGTAKANSVLAVFEGVEGFGGAVFVHRLDLAVTGDAAFDPRLRCRLRLW
jgi:hypothetical protein